MAKACKLCKKVINRKNSLGPVCAECHVADKEEYIKRILELEREKIELSERLEKALVFITKKLRQSLQKWESGKKCG